MNTNDYAVHLTHWALAVAGGSIVILLGSISVRQLGKKMRLSYLLYLAVWALLGLSLNCGSTIITDNLNTATQFTFESRLTELGIQVRDNAASQLLYYNWALYIFGLWLLIYLLGWIFSNNRPQRS